MLASMPTDGDFGVRLVVGGGDDGVPQRDLDEVTDTLTGRVYAVSRAGDEYKIKMSGPGDKHVGAIIQVDGACDMHTVHNGSNRGALSVSVISTTDTRCIHSQ